MPRTLIMVPSPGGRTMTAAHALRACLQARCGRADVCDAEQSPTDCDVAVIGIELGRHRDRRVLGDYIARHRTALDRVQTALFVVSGARHSGALAHRYIEWLQRDLRWRPTLPASFVLRQRDRLASRLLVAALRGLVGSKNANPVDELADLARSIVREMHHARRA